jgi:hypothetical protein
MGQPGSNGREGRRARDRSLQCLANFSGGSYDVTDAGRRFIFVAFDERQEVAGEQRVWQLTNCCAANPYEPKPDGRHGDQV